MSKIKLTAPSLEMKKPALEFRREFGGLKISGSCGWHHREDYSEWLEQVKRVSQGLEEGRLPSSLYFAFSQPENRIVGIVDIRHYLTEGTYHNGHVGYSVRPSERGKGYGTEILRLALDKAKELGILEVVVSANKHNIASRKVIRRNGLIKKEEIVEENGNVLWLYSLD